MQILDPNSSLQIPHEKRASRKAQACLTFTVKGPSAISQGEGRGSKAQDRPPWLQVQKYRKMEIS